MNAILESEEAVQAPMRASYTDDPLDILRFAITSFRQGGTALATLVDIQGGAARALGSQVAVAADGSFCGYVSGGCVENAVAGEALIAIKCVRDRMVTYGNGSPFFDIVLPCGGGITIAIHVLREIETLQRAVSAVQLRQACAISYSPTRETIGYKEATLKSSWEDGNFVTIYRPRTRTVVCGQSAEALAVSKIADAAGHEVILSTDRDLSRLRHVIDPYTAVILLYHDPDAEERSLEYALRSGAFYIGALGSTRTHRRRIDRLKKAGFTEDHIKRIKAPIGIFGPTKESMSLALSVVADVAATRMALHP